jgi:hypothetical protein
MTFRLTSSFLLCWAVYGTLACGDSEKDRAGAVGDGCGSDADADACQAGLSCDPLADGSGKVCGQPVTLSGKVSDALNDSAIAGARVLALSEEGAPVGNVSVSDADGAYELLVPAPRNADGSIAADATWTLNASAAGYQPFPAGPRPAVPISGDQASGERPVIEAANTRVNLLPLTDPAALDRQITGTLSGPDVGGTLVVAEGGATPAPYTIAAADGSFVLFNVPAGQFQIAGYRRGTQFDRVTADTRAGSVGELTLSPSEEPLGDVSGNVNIVNAPGGSLTSVVLVPGSVFDAVQERGPVPFGMRAPEAPGSPSIQGAFSMSGIPRGEYVVLAAFENDLLVRDPDTGIGGTSIQRVTMADGDAVSMAESFKVTEQLAVVSPGAEGPDVVSGTPVFRWADDSSEDRYELELYSALGDLVWFDRAIPGASGVGTVELSYGGPALLPGMIYQFRVTSIRDRREGPTPITRSEDLRGVFSYE